MRKHKSKQYGRMIGSDIAIVKFSELTQDNPTLRLDAKFHLNRIKKESAGEEVTA